MKSIEKWLDEVFEDTIPNEVVAIAFNLYEDGDNQWSIEMIGSDNFDAGNSDWVCDEIFNTRDDLQSWVQQTTWENVLQEIINAIEKYMQMGKYAEQMKSYKGVGVGFVDGDITIIYP